MSIYKDLFIRHRCANPYKITWKQFVEYCNELVLESNCEKMDALNKALLSFYLVHDRITYLGLRRLELKYQKINKNTECIQNAYDLLSQKHLENESVHYVTK